MRTVLVSIAVATSVVFVPRAQDSGVVIHDLASAPFHTRGALQLKAVVTDEGSVGLAIARGGVTQAGHHHQQEQVVIPIDGPMEFSVAGVLHRLNQYAAAIPPSNTKHFYVTGATTSFIEYQPIRRDDWAPPFPANKLVQSPEPLPGQAGREIARDLSPGSPAWSGSGVARMKELTGEQVKIVMLELNGRGTIEIPTAVTARQFVYVITGTPSLTAGAAQQGLKPHSVIELTRAAKAIRLEPPREGTSLIAVFSRLR